MSKKNNTITILDIGASKIVCFIAEVMASDLVIKGIGNSESAGVKSGLIVNIQQAKASISKAVALAAKMAGIKPKYVTCSVSSSVLLSQNLKTQTSITGKEINQNDMTRLVLGVRELIDTKDYEILHNFIYDYKLDGYSGITNPVGMYGRDLSCSVNTMLCQKNVLLNYQQCLNQLGLEINEFVAAPLAASYGLFSEDDDECGAILIDLGFSASSISYIKGRQVIFSESVPIGGQHITQDLMQVLGINFETADKIKSLYASLAAKSHDNDDISAQTVIDLQDTSAVTSQQPITKGFLNEIIEARFEEIVELLQDKLRDCPYNVASSRVVLSGGIAKLAGVPEFLERYGFKTSSQQPIYINGIADSVTTPAFANAIGLLQYAKEQYDKKAAGSKRFSINSMLGWLKENF